MKSETEQALAESLRGVSSPQSLKVLQSSMRVRRGIAPEVVTSALTELVRDQTAYLWPAFRGAVRYWHCDPDGYVRDRIVDIASKAALAQTELLKQTGKVSFRCNLAFLQKNLRVLIGEGKIVKARTVGQLQLLYAAGATQALIASSLELLRLRLLKSGVPEDQVRGLTLDGGRPESAPVQAAAGTVDAGARILEALRDIESSPGAPVTARTLRARLADLDKAGFDRAVMQLAEEQRVYVTLHDHGWALPEADRLQLIHDGGANLYVAVASRQ